MKVNIIGGGLAGCALAYVLKHEGLEPIIYEASDSLASGASGNDVGLYNPRFTAFYDAIGQFYGAAFQGALREFELLGDAIDWNPCGAIHLVNNEQKERRFGKMLQNWPSDIVELLYLDKEEASKAAGISLDYNALYLPRSGTVSPKKLCAEYARGVDVRLNSKVDDFPEGVTVLACGMACTYFGVAKTLPIKAVRGQVTYVRSNPVSQALKTTVGFGGYVSPSRDGVHCVGATFERGVNDAHELSADNLSNLNNLFQNVEVLRGEYNVVDGRAGIRVASPDHCPIFGQLSEGVYVSTAGGSHGILNSLQAAKLLAKLIIKQDAVPSIFSPQRFKA